MNNPQTIAHHGVDGFTHGEVAHVRDVWRRLAESWLEQATIEGVLGVLPELRQRGLDLTMEPLHAVPEWLQLRVTSAMTLSYEGGSDAIGFSLTDVFMLPDTQQQLVTWMMRRGEVSLEHRNSHHAATS